MNREEFFEKWCVGLADVPSSQWIDEKQFNTDLDSVINSEVDALIEKLKERIRIEYDCSAEISNLGTDIADIINYQYAKIKGKK